MIEDAVALNEKMMGISVSRIKVLLLSIHYPFAIKNYFENALRRRGDIDLITTGPFTGSWTPWMGGMNLPAKYVRTPNIPLALPTNVGRVPYSLVQAQLPDGWVPDVVLCIDAGISWTSKPTQGSVLGVGTDAHVLDYDYHRKNCDIFFNMHPHYSKLGDHQIHYAYDPGVHYPMPEIEKDLDVALIGLPYQHRVDLVNKLRFLGINVAFENGPVFDEYRILNNRSKIGLNWSSMEDLNARAFEIGAMKLAPVMNYVPDLDRFPALEDATGVFDSLEQAVEEIQFLLGSPSMIDELSSAAYNAVIPYTYDALVEEMLFAARMI